MPLEPDRQRSGGGFCHSVSMLRESWMRRWAYMLAAVLVLVLVLAGIKGYFIYKMIQGFKAQGVPKYTVSAPKLNCRTGCRRKRW